MKRSAMQPSAKPMRRSAIARKAPKKRPGHDKAMLNACRGQDCYLAISGICRGDLATVVPAHRNEGKGLGLKVPDKLTVPACFHCHSEYDQGHFLTRDEKRALLDAAYARWESVRGLT